MDGLIRIGRLLFAVAMMFFGVQYLIFCQWSCGAGAWASVESGEPWSGLGGWD
jgi:hypothetical protein